MSIKDKLFRRFAKMFQITRDKIHRSSGFTIVELLIVIVVVGVLAAIILATYNGLQSRAMVSRAASAANAYEKSLKMYKLENGNYPYVAGAQEFCLGAIEQYPAADGFAAGQCMRSATAFQFVLNTTVSAGLKTYLSNYPNVEWPTVQVGTTYYRGIYYSGAPYGPNPSIIMASLMYYVKGNTSCPINAVRDYIAASNATFCTIEID